MIIRRSYSVPENITLFYVGAGLVASVYPLIMAHTGGHGLECPLRALTGLPCPFCGLTTATVALTHGHWTTAAATSPLAYLVAALALGTAPVLVARNAGLVTRPRAWSPAARRRTARVVAMVVALSWVFQLHRYGFL